MRGFWMPWCLRSSFHNLLKPILCAPNALWNKEMTCFYYNCRERTCVVTILQLCRGPDFLKTAQSSKWLLAMYVFCKPWTCWNFMSFRFKVLFLCRDNAALMVGLGSCTSTAWFKALLSPETQLGLSRGLVKKKHKKKKTHWEIVPVSFKLYSCFNTCWNTVLNRGHWLGL